MFVIQKRKSPACQWKTATFGNKRRRYETIYQAWAALRAQKNKTDSEKYPFMEFRILDTETGEVVE